MRKFLLHLFLFSALVFSCEYVLAQTETEKLSAIILHKDSLFWKEYNACATAQYKDFFTDDVEFYHDKGGMMQGLDSLVATTKKNLCSNNNFRLRREAVAGTLKVFPLQNSNVIYGAILSGEHVFYIIENGKEPRLDGLAKFTHLWLLQNGEWKMTRILSYDHGPAPYKNNKKEISLADNILRKYEGYYAGPQIGAMSVHLENGFLILKIKNKNYVLHPESSDRFFTKDRDLSFEFQVNAGNQVSKMLVRESGSVVEEAVFSGKK